MHEEIERLVRLKKAEMDRDRSAAGFFLGLLKLQLVLVGILIAIVVILWVMYGHEI